MKTYVYEIELEEDEDGRWAANCPALPGCATWGRTADEALRNIQEAVEVYVADVLAAGESVPTPTEVIQAPAVSVAIP